MIFLLGNYLSHHHDLPGFFAFVMLFVATWLAWGETTVYNSLYVSTDWLYRLCTAFQTLSVMFMAASIPAIEPSLATRVMDSLTFAPHMVWKESFSG